MKRFKLTFTNGRVAYVEYRNYSEAYNAANEVAKVLDLKFTVEHIGKVNK